MTTMMPPHHLAVRWAKAICTRSGEGCAWRPEAENGKPREKDDYGSEKDGNDHARVSGIGDEDEGNLDHETRSNKSQGTNQLSTHLASHSCLLRCTLQLGDAVPLIDTKLPPPLTRRPRADSYSASSQRLYAVTLGEITEMRSIFSARKQAFWMHRPPVDFLL